MRGISLSATLDSLRLSFFLEGLILELERQVLHGTKVHEEQAASRSWFQGIASTPTGVR
ncbi:hypothetical protein [Streptomyces rubradiris]|uniref:hypothetical protein n=1 Tax=Streptomyces rubradiris TaxID=285531 RepID=UPI0016756D84|nr:hypothetical protein [Streptomyces rubradiris]